MDRYHYPVNHRENVAEDRMQHACFLLNPYCPKTSKGSRGHCSTAATANQLTVDHHHASRSTLAAPRLDRLRSCRTALNYRPRSLGLRFRNRPRNLDRDRWLFWTLRQKRSVPVPTLTLRASLRRIVRLRVPDMTTKITLPRINLYNAHASISSITFSSSATSGSRHRKAGTVVPASNPRPKPLEDNDYHHYNPPETHTP